MKDNFHLLPSEIEEIFDEVFFGRQVTLAETREEVVAASKAMSAVADRYVNICVDLQTRCNAAEGKKMKKIRVIFPLLKCKTGKPRVKQPAVAVGMNGKTCVIPRGEIAIVPEWVQEICDKTDYLYECFVSSQAVKE